MSRSFIVEADGGSRGNPGPAAYGSVVKDAATGQTLVEAAEHIGIASNNVAEYRGLIAGLRAALVLDPECTVEARLDSKLVVEQMSGRWQIKHPSMRPLAIEARGIFPPGRVSYTWVPRAMNSHADRLANEALDDAARGRGWRGSEYAAREGESDPAPAAVPPVAVPAPRPEPVLDSAEVEPSTSVGAVVGSEVLPRNTLVGWADLGPPTKFLMLRHGETVHTVEKVFSGSGGEDPPLTDDGRRQAAAAASLVADRSKTGGWHGVTKVHAVISSPLLRARQTAELAAAALGVELRIEDGLAECAFGDWEGSTLAEIQRDHPKQLADWLASSAVAPPGGESLDQVGRRVRTARDRLIARYPRHTLLVVSHVTPIKELVRDALNAAAHSMYRMELQPGSLTLLDWYADGNASMRAFNETPG